MNLFNEMNKVDINWRCCKESRSRREYFDKLIDSNPLKLASILESTSCSLLATYEMI
jgi:hypothetical protein